MLLNIPNFMSKCCVLEQPANTAAMLRCMCCRADRSRENRDDLSRSMLSLSEFVKSPKGRSGPPIAPGRRCRYHTWRHDLLPFLET